jgi:hypothetical protein
LTQFDDPVSTTVAPAVLLDDIPASPTKPKFHPGLQLGLDDARTLGARRRVRLIGILGTPNAGKTAALVSLYLLVARARIGRWRFGNSLSLMAFEMLARGTRRWADGGEMPTQMTTHTKLADPRAPGFLHLRVRDSVEAAAFDLLFPDLPGEWTDALIDTNTHERLAFMRDAESLWLMVDGVTLANPDLRKGPLGRLKLLLGRLTQIVSIRTPLVIVVTRRDQYGPSMTDVLKGVTDEAARLGFLNVKIVEIASFSDNGAIPPGTGLDELLQLSVNDGPTPMMASQTRGVPHASRHVLRYRST